MAAMNRLVPLESPRPLQSDNKALIIARKHLLYANRRSDAATTPRSRTMTTSVGQVRVHRNELGPHEPIIQSAASKVRDAIVDGKGQVGMDVATSVKLDLDESYGGTWHCIIGKNFGCSITHECKKLTFFQIDDYYVLIFCTEEVEEICLESLDGAFTEERMV
mmetsp:Transcript_55844/g.153971  ORF Transcript_55844/g.153971 Transcript_55844/m.153971 type:complete len:163 (+) Transcript_55844:337-825(+)